MRFTVAACGLLVLAALWLGPLPLRASRSFTAHMALHMGIVAVAAPLLAIGVAGGRIDPVRKVPWLFPPVPASVVELIVVWAWHAPALHHAARHSVVGLALEQGSFFLAGLLLWLSVLGGDPGPRSNRAAAGVVALLLTTMHMTLLGALLALSPRALYGHAGLGSLEDQQLGGAIMIAAAGLSCLFGGLCLTAGLLRSGPQVRPA